MGAGNSAIGQGTSHIFADDRMGGGASSGGDLILLEGSITDAILMEGGLGFILQQ